MGNGRFSPGSDKRSRQTSQLSQFLEPHLWRKNGSILAGSSFNVQLNSDVNLALCLSSSGLEYVYAFAGIVTILRAFLITLASHSQTETHNERLAFVVFADFESQLLSIASLD
ncbi:hypothetical protein DdX_19774 [Ditylenchus destructor]|uniref:Uncharacterized protein n=1 Tax=Ditylenchus destructor TaxID=166010 RepID=A0AAD4MIE6_9BILA|nr:hypothetical protein DdX_19774 [Ditylenchus destructor]